MEEATAGVFNTQRGCGERGLGGDQWSENDGKRARTWYNITDPNPGSPMSPLLKTILLLVCSNTFMTFAWYAHLKNLHDRPWIVAALVSWGIAFFEYLLQVPANRIGYTQLSLGQLKMLQEVITLSVFVPFALLYMRQPLRLNFLWAGLCLCGAVYFMFKR